MGKIVKNRKWERECFRMLASIFGDATKLESDALRAPGLWIECQHSRRVDILAALNRAVDEHAAAMRGVLSFAARDAPDDTKPIAFCKESSQPAVVGLLLVDFLDLMSELWSLKTKQEEPKHARNQTVRARNRAGNPSVRGRALQTNLSQG